MPFVSGDDETHARLGNPVSENESYLRASLLESISRRAEFNLAHRVADIRLFEIGSAFSPAPDGSGLPLEQMRLGILMMGRRRPAHFTEPQPPAIDEWDARGVAEVLSRVAFPDAAIDLAPALAAGRLWEIQRDGAPIGTVQRLALDAPIWAASAYGIEITLGDVATAAPAARGTHSYRDHGQGPRTAVSRFRPLPAMPPAEFDLALLVPIGTPASRVESVIRDAAGDLLERLELFDQYTGAGIDPGHRSLAWRLTFRHPDRTLRDKEIEGRRNKILGALQKELHVRQRTA